MTKTTAPYFQAEINGTITLNGIEADQLVSDMHRAFQNAVGAGALTDNTAAEVNSYNLNVEIAETEIEALQTRITSDIARLRKIALDPVDIVYDRNVSFEIRPVEEGSRLNVYRKDWGCTLVNYTDEGVIVDVTGEEGMSCHSSIALHSSELELPLEPEVQPSGHVENKDLKKEKTVIFYVDAHSASDDFDCPSHAKLLVNHKFIEKLQYLQSVVRMAQLSEVNLSGSGHPEMWLPAEYEDEAQLCCGELVVSALDFWFTDVPKHSYSFIETRSFSIAQLERLFALAEDGDLINSCENFNLLENLLEDIASIWTEEDATASEAEGWMLSLNHGEENSYQLQRTNEKSVFLNDADAEKYVWRKAIEHGVESLYSRALSTLKLVSNNEYLMIAESCTKL